MNLSNSTILITGGSSGIGYAIAKRLLERGATVIITGRDKLKLTTAQSLLPGVNFLQSDVSDPEAITRLYTDVIAKFPNLNILINNAGELRQLLLQDKHPDLRDLTREIDLNLMGPIRMVQQFLPHLAKQKEAAILNVSSGLATVAFPIAPVYGATKAGLHSYTQALRVQLKHTRIKVYELLPPAVNTPLNDALLSVDGFDSKTIEPVKIADAAVKGLEKDTLEIYPGLSKMVHVMSRIAPRFLLSQLSKFGAKAMQKS